MNPLRGYVSSNDGHYLGWLFVGVPRDQHGILPLGVRTDVWSNCGAWRVTDALGRVFGYSAKCMAALHRDFNVERQWTTQYRETLDYVELCRKRRGQC